MGQSFFCDKCWFMTYRDAVALSKGQTVRYDNTYSLASSSGAPVQSDVIQYNSFGINSAFFAGVCTVVELDCIILRIVHNILATPFGSQNIRNTFSL